MDRGIIKENKVFCNNNHHNYTVKDYKEVIINGKKYIKYISRCKECGEEFYYFARITMADTEYFTFNEEEGQEINEQEE